MSEKARSGVTDSAEIPPMPECECVAKGQPIIPSGDLAGLVVHRADCAWMAWERATGGCMGDD